MIKALFLRRKGLGYESTLGMSQYIGNGCKSVLNVDITDEDFEGYDLVIRWGCTSTIPIKNVLNKTPAIHLSSNKSGFRSVMQECGGLCPKTWFGLLDFAKDVAVGQATYPVIVRPQRHSQGNNLYLCNSFKEVADATHECGGGFYISEYIRKLSEYRVHVVQGRVSTVEEKVPKDPNDIAWNQHQGSAFKNVRWDSWNLDAVDKAIQAIKLCELDFGGVDVIVDGKGQSYVLEINSAPSVPMIINGDRRGEPSYNQISMAKCFKYLLESGVRGDIEIPQNVDKTYKHYVHPAITDRAILQGV